MRFSTETQNRRTVLKALGVGGTAALAGCMSNDEPAEEDDPEETSSEDGIAIDPGETIELTGYASHWEGTAPASIEGMENPTLRLEAEGDYTVEWTNGDGMTHDFQIADDAGETVGDAATDDVGTEDEGATLEFTADAAMVEYLCSYHVAQAGDLIVE